MASRKGLKWDRLSLWWGLVSRRERTEGTRHGGSDNGLGGLVGRYGLKVPTVGWAGRKEWLEGAQGRLVG